MYTVQEVYDKMLLESDKMGSDYLTVPEALIRFKKAAYDFIGQKAAEAEKTQEITQDIQNLVRIQQISAVIDPNVLGTYMAAFPSDYYQRLRLTVYYNETEKSRLPRFQKIGEANVNEVSPYKKPTKDYPLITIYSDYMNINANSATILKVAFTYFKKPVFGSALTDIMLNLPISAMDQIISIMISEWLVEKGDPRGQSQFQLKETSRKPR